MPTASERSRLISIVQSRQNARVRELRAAFARAGRDPAEAIALEGEHLLAEALRSGLRLRTVFVRARSPAPRSAPAAPRPAAHSPRRPHRRAHPARLRQRRRNRVAPGHCRPGSIPRAFPSTISSAQPAPLVVIAAGLQDPGNFGTLIRSAEAFGGRRRPRSPRHRQRLERQSPARLRRLRLPRPGCGGETGAGLCRPHRSTASRLRGRARLLRLPKRSPARRWTGPAPPLSSSATKAAASPRICSTAPTTSSPSPPPAPVESPNAAVAASVLLYEAARQRALP